MINRQEELEKVLDIVSRFDMTIAPIEPTQEMIDTALNVVSNKDLTKEDLKTIYATMLATFQDELE